MISGGRKNFAYHISNVAEKFSATSAQQVTRILRLTKSNCARRSLICAALVVVKMSASFLKNQKCKMRL